MGAGEAPARRLAVPEAPIGPPPAVPELVPLVPGLVFPDLPAADLGRLISGPITPRERWAARELAERLALRGGYESLLALDQFAIDVHEYQVRTVRRVLAEMRGNAILADEVGLGKTIEAGPGAERTHHSRPRALVPDPHTGPTGGAVD